MSKYRQAARGSEVDGICWRCGEHFVYTKHNSRKRKYCSSGCQNKAHSERMLGSNNSNYKGIENYTYVCPVCAKEFISYRKDAQYCSLSCKAKNPDNVARMKKLAPIAAKLPRKKREKTGRSCVCKCCGVKFKSDKRLTYCEKHNGYRNGNPPNEKAAICAVCGKEFKREHPGNKRTTCSRHCRQTLMSKIQRGARSHRWEGGKTSEAMIIRNSLAYSRWRKTVFVRDDYTCQICNQRGGKLSADHIKPFSTHPQLRLSVDNGRTLCVECHKKTDTFGAGAKRYEVSTTQV